MDGEVARAGSQFGDLSCAMYVDVIANHGRAGTGHHGGRDWGGRK